jgi:hypothetical protein
MQAWLSGHSTIVLLGILLLTFLMMLPSATLSPIAWGDEAVIVDFGRVLLSGDTTYGLTSRSFGEAVIDPFYIGVSYAEAIYRQFGHWGIRASSILFGIVSAYLLFRIACRLLSGTPIICMALALAFVFSTNYAQSYRSGRLDSLSITLVFLALYLLLNERRPIASLAASATLMSMAVLVWPTSMMLAPFWLIFYGVAHAREGLNWRRLIGDAALVFVVVFVVATSVYFAVGGAAGSLLLISDLLSAHDTTQEGIRLLLEKLVHLGLIDAAITIPAILLLAYFLLARRSVIFITLSASVAAAVVLTLFTTPYVHRYVYLLALLCLAVVFCLRETQGPIRQLVTAFLVASALLGWGLQVVGRSAVAVTQYADRSPKGAAIMTSSIDCSKNQRVYLQAFHLYFQLREKGCRVDRIFWSADEIASVLRDEAAYNYVVLGSEEQEFATALQAVGWRLTKVGAGQGYQAPLWVAIPSR